MATSAAMSSSLLIDITLTIFNESLLLNLTEIDFKLDEKIAFTSPNKLETKDDENIDDFKEFFDSIGLRLIYFFG